MTPSTAQPPKLNGENYIPRSVLLNLGPDFSAETHNFVVGQGFTATHNLSVYVRDMPNILAACKKYMHSWTSQGILKKGDIVTMTPCKPGPASHILQAMIAGYTGNPVSVLIITRDETGTYAPNAKDPVVNLQYMESWGANL